VVAESARKWAGRSTSAHALGGQLAKTEALVRTIEAPFAGMKCRLDLIEIRGPIDRASWRRRRLPFEAFCTRSLDAGEAAAVRRQRSVTFHRSFRVRGKIALQFDPPRELPFARVDVEIGDSRFTATCKGHRAKDAAAAPDSAYDGSDRSDAVLTTGG